MSSTDSLRPSHRSGWVLLVASLLWLPGQAHASAPRYWALVAVLPWLVPWSALRSRRVATLVAPWLGLALLSGLSALFVPAPGAALRVAGLQVGWAAAVLFGASSGAPAPSFVAAAGSVAAMGLWLMPGGLFGNATYAATFIAPCLVWVLLSDLPRRAKGGSSLILLAGLYRAESLAGTAAVAVSLGAYAIVRARTMRWPMRLGLAATATAAVALLPGLYAHVLGRWHMTRLAWQVALDHAPLGTGAGQFTGPYLEAQAHALANGSLAADTWNLLDHVHNEWLHTWAEQGPLGLLLLAAPMVIAFRRGLPAPAWGAAVAICVTGLVSLPFYEPATALLFGMCVGQSARGVGSMPVARWARWPALAGLIALSVVASADLVGDRLTVSAAARNDPQALDWAASLTLRPEAALRAKADRLLPDHPTQALSAAKEAVRRVPTPTAWLLVGRAALAGLQPLDAVEAYREAVRLHPRLVAGWVGLSYALHHAGDPFGARRAASRAKALHPEDARLLLLPR